MFLQVVGLPDAMLSLVNKVLELELSGNTLFLCVCTYVWIFSNDPSVANSMQHV